MGPGVARLALGLRQVLAGRCMERLDRATLWRTARDRVRKEVLLFDAESVARVHGVPRVRQSAIKHSRGWAAPQPFARAGPAVSPRKGRL